MARRSAPKFANGAQVRVCKGARFEILRDGHRVDDSRSKEMVAGTVVNAIGNVIWVRLEADLEMESGTKYSSGSVLPLYDTDILER